GRARCARRRRGPSRAEQQRKERAMSGYRCAVVAGLTAGWLHGGAMAQEQVVASLPFQFGQTAGPNGTDYSDNTKDLWIIEDFAIAADKALTRFESYGTIFPAPLVVSDVTVRIYD